MEVNKKHSVQLAGYGSTWRWEISASAGDLGLDMGCGSSAVEAGEILSSVMAHPIQQDLSVNITLFLFALWYKWDGKKQGWEYDTVRPPQVSRYVVKVTQGSVPLVSPSKSCSL